MSEPAVTQVRLPAITAELYVIPLQDRRYLVYAPLRRAAFVSNARVVNFLTALRDQPEQILPTDASLVEFLRRLEILDSAPEAQPIVEFRGDPMPTTLTLFLTTACNLRCTYCYASAGDTPLKTMPLEVAIRGINFVSANAHSRGEPRFQIAYHGGGEPTANWNVMTASHAYARSRADKLGISVHASSASNGVLRDEQIDWMIENLSSVSLSFDGLPEVHDRHRLTVWGDGSSKRVMHTMERFDAVGFGYGVRMTVTADQIERLPDSVDFVCSRFQPKRIQVEPAYQLGRWSAAPSAETEEFVTAFRKAQDRANSRGFEITYSAARLGDLTNHFCGISQDSFALSPDGNVSACYESFSEDNPFADVFFYGTPDPSSSGYKFKLRVLNNLREQAVQHRAFCQGCFAKWHCAGDCLHKSLTVNGRGEFAGSDRCHITRELTKDQILARIAASGGLFWHEPIEEPMSLVSEGKELLS